MSKLRLVYLDPNLTADQVDEINFLLTQIEVNSRKWERDDLNELLSYNFNSPNGRPSFWLLAAINEDDYIIGMASLVIVRTLGITKGLIEDVSVHPDYRNRGLGEKLVTMLLQKAGKLKLMEVNLTSHPSRASANRLYKRMGFQMGTTNFYSFKL